jgi:hypothetical protein
MEARKGFGCLALLLVAGWIEDARCQERLPPIVTVRIYNHARVAPEVLVRARNTVARIFHDSGIQVTWLEPSSEQPASQFAVRVIVRRNSDGFSGGSRVMGTTLGDEHEMGRAVYIFKDRVLEIAHKRHQDVAQLFAYAIAHELGHVLLPRPAHTAEGIMRAEWNGFDLRHIASDFLRFTPPQATQMRSKLATTSSEP